MRLSKNDSVGFVIKEQNIFWLGVEFRSMHCKKKSSDFPVPSGDVTNQTLSLAGKNVIFLRQGEFG